MTSLCEKGMDEDAGRFRLSFFLRTLSVDLHRRRERQDYPPVDDRLWRASAACVRPQAQGIALRRRKPPSRTGRASSHAPSSQVKQRLQPRRFDMQPEARLRSRDEAAQIREHDRRGRRARGEVGGRPLHAAQRRVGAGDVDRRPAVVDLVAHQPSRQPSGRAERRRRDEQRSVAGDAERMRALGPRARRGRRAARRAQARRSPLRDRRRSAHARAR